MAQILPRHYIIAIMIFTMFIIGGVALIAEFKAVDNAFVDDERYSDFNQTFNKYDEVIEISEDTQTNIENMEDADFGIFGVLNSLINQAWQFLRLLMSSLGFMNDAFNGISAMFGVPSWVPAIIIAIVTILIGFAIFGAIFQRDI